MKDIQELLDRLAKVKPIGNGIYQALCPAHKDRLPSLHITQKDNKILLHCKAGCPTAQVLEALDLKMRDLFISGNNNKPGELGQVVATYIYLDANSIPLFEVLRYQPKTFRQRHYDGKGQPVWGLGDITPVLYHLPDIKRAVLAGDTIYFVEGEKDADRLWLNGLVATCNPMGAGKWQQSYTDTLAGGNVVVVADKDESGRQHAHYIARELDGVAKSLKVMELPGREVNDISDWFDRGGESPELQGMTEKQPQFSTLPIINAVDLMKKEFPPIKWVIPNILPDGTTLLCGKPKAGKSVFVLGLCLGVASGGYAMGNIQVEKGDVLYLSLEDGERRLRERLELLLEGGKIPSGLDIACRWAKIDEGGIEDIEHWLEKHPKARLIVVDTLKRIKPKENVGFSLYGQDYDSIQPLSELAKKWNISIIINHHLNKMRDADDPMDLISGSTGLTGAVDNAFVIKKSRSEADAVLFCCGRDIEDKKLALRLDYPCWVLLGDANEFTASQERQEIMEYLRSNPGETPTQVASGIGKALSATKFLMWKISKDELIISEKGKYRVV